MGSRLNSEIAYIAGFLDGDGSLMLQIKKRKDSKAGIRFMATICFYQDSRHDEPLSWIREKFGIGYLSHRNDGMTELRINGYRQVERVLRQLLPHIRFKKKQANALVHACEILHHGTIRTLTNKNKELLVSCMITMQKENYVTKKKRDKKELYTLLGLTP